MNFNPLANPYEADDYASVPTDDAEEVDSDNMLDVPVQNVGDIMDASHDGKVKKEIIEVGEGVKKPKMNYIATIIYEAYFFDHETFDSSNGKEVQFVLGDISWPEGLWKGIEEMRKGEKAKIKIKKKYGFGRKANVDKMKFPAGYEEEGSAARQRLMTKGIIYEVKLVDWIERIDVEADGNFIKTYLNKPSRKDWERPADQDEIKINIQVYQNPENVLWEKHEWKVNLDNDEITPAIRKAIESLKRQEKSVVQIKGDYVRDTDPQLIQKLGLSEDFDSIQLKLELLNLIKVEDWFKEGTTIKRVLRRGKGRAPDIDSTVKLRLRITVNGDKPILDNYVGCTSEEDFAKSEDLSLLSAEEREKAAEDQSLYTFRLDDYTLPSLLLKVVKAMKPNEVSHVITTRTDKLHSNFTNPLFDQYAVFKEGDKVQFFITMVHVKDVGYFYQQLISEKLARVTHMKAIAGQFFRKSNFKKASKIYQKINGYFNFGDSTNNYAKEDEASEIYQKTNAELQAFKLTCFLNLVVCKTKMKEWQSVVSITDQIFEMDSKNAKAYYFRGKALVELQEYDQAVDAVSKALDFDPANADIKNELIRVKKIRKNDIEKQQKVYKKFFES